MAGAAAGTAAHRHVMQVGRDAYQANQPGHPSWMAGFVLRDRLAGRA